MPLSKKKIILGKESLSDEPRKHPVKDGWDIHLYSHILMTSPGEKRRTTHLNPMFTTVNAMIELLKKQEVNTIYLFGDERAKQFAWEKCMTTSIQINNFSPSDKQTQKLKHAYEKIF